MDEIETLHTRIANTFNEGYLGVFVEDHPHLEWRSYLKNKGLHVFYLEPAGPYLVVQDREVMKKPWIKIIE